MYFSHFLPFKKHTHQGFDYDFLGHRICLHSILGTFLVSVDANRIQHNNSKIVKDMTFTSNPEYPVFILCLLNGLMHKESSSSHIQVLGFVI